MRGSANGWGGQSLCLFMKGFDEEQFKPELLVDEPVEDVHIRASLTK
ncbi:hypothetical protein Pth03_45450 [Planotetraspora thailandica]|uniref:Uncharacterized protein n=1 Tax=Planotetraspora thailandica TaxID=487172 RepID=A0A8J3V3J9_9ACTN|nr:hypothetical protein [Planotetraspora thailandica]GII56156.1 hypothetical protein Pth03_45450 [Planotetraspora thailandica]